jgi:hypothetical protein
MGYGLAQKMLKVVLSLYIAYLEICSDTNKY